MNDPYAPRPTIAAMASVNAVLDVNPIPGEDDIYADPRYSWEDLGDAVEYLYVVGDIVYISDDSPTSEYGSYCRREYLSKLEALGLVERRVIRDFDQGDAESGPRSITENDLYWGWTRLSGFDGR